MKNQTYFTAGVIVACLASDAFFTLEPRADINADGSITSQDFFDFLGAFFAGC